MWSAGSAPTGGLSSLRKNSVTPKRELSNRSTMDCTICSLHCLREAVTEPSRLPRISRCRHSKKLDSIREMLTSSMASSSRNDPRPDLREQSLTQIWPTHRSPR